MLAPRSSRFFGAALQSGLVDEAGLTACWEMIAPERRTPEAIDRRLARQAIASGKLTLWQAQQLLSGRISGYFIDKYVLLSLLGRGGMGRVFLAKDVRLNRTVALKLLSQERMNNPRAIARFRREAKVGAQLQHENLVRVYDEGDSAGVSYLVMEHIDGKNVAQAIGELGKIPWPTAARLARQVALGLEHARLKGLIHRDVNPGNILITQDGTAKLTDLGLAIDLNDLDNVTREGATVGTFDYVSPEQAKNSRSVDTRADLYSLGCTLFHMIAGRVPFPMPSLPEKLYAHQLHDPEPLTELTPETPEGLAEVVRRLMRKSPDERYQTPADLAAVLEPYAIESGWTTTAGNNGAGIAAGVTGRSGSGESPNGVEGSSLNLIPVVPTPTAGLGMGESFLPLDLGPDEPLAGHLHKPSRSRTSSFSPEDGDRPGTTTAQGPRRYKVGLVAAVGFTALVAAGVIATLANLAASKTDGTTTPGLVGSRAEKGRPNPRPTGPKAVQPPTAPGDVVVRFRDGTSETAANLAVALGRAVRDRAEVILAAGTTVRLSNEAPIRIPDGGVTIRGAAGAPPTIEVTMKGTQPAFLVGANLKLADLIVVVRADGTPDVPVWQTERDLTCERCIFRTMTPPAPAVAEPAAAVPSRLILAEGAKLIVTRCLFAGFDRPIELAAGPGAAATLDQSIIIAGQLGDAAPLVGRALVVRSIFGGGGDVQIKVVGCSTRSEVFLEANQFAAGAPLKVEVADSAVWANTLLECDGPGGTDTSAGGDKPAWSTIRQMVGWQGRSNRFHLDPLARPWARLTDGTALAGPPTSLEAWAVAGRESNSQAGTLRFCRASAPPSNEPADYALTTGDLTKSVGADAGQVGPRPAR